MFTNMQTKSESLHRKLALTPLVIGVLTLGLLTRLAGAGETEVNQPFNRGDIRNVPQPLNDRLAQLIEQPHAYPAITAFNEATNPSMLFQYYLLDQSRFQPNVFTAQIQGISDTATPPASGALRAIRVVSEAKPGKALDPPRLCERDNQCLYSGDLGRPVARRRSVACWRLLSAPACAAAAAMRATPAPGAHAHFTLDPDVTRITVAVAEPLSSIRGDAVGSFTAVSGEVDDADDNPSHARVRLVIDAASYSSGSRMRDRAVTASSLAAGQFPTITFESSGLKDVKLDSPRSGSATMVGELTLRGQSRVIEFLVSASLGNDGRLTAEGVASFDYTQFGIRPPSILGLSAGKEAKVRFHVVAVQAAPRLLGLLAGGEHFL